MEEIIPPKRLALAHAPRDFKAAFSVLLQFDSRLGVIVANGGEAVIGQMKMAWWRDVMAKPPQSRPKGEPLVQQLNILQDSGKHPDLENRMLDCIDAWDCLLTEDIWSDELLLKHADHRASAIFGQDSLAAHQWALHDIAALMGHDVSAAIAKLPQDASRVKLPRYLSIMEMAARQQFNAGGPASGLRLMLHALTGL